MPPNPTTLAERIAKQNGEMAAHGYDGILKTTESFGPQPFDPETGEPQAKIGEPEQMELHAIIRDSNEGILMTLMGEAERIGLSEGLLPRQMVKDMIAAERRHRNIDGGE